jgi:hypothetical protein
MTVGELIQYLQQVDPDLPVYTFSADEEMEPATGVVIYDCYNYFQPPAPKFVALDS